MDYENFDLHFEVTPAGRQARHRGSRGRQVVVDFTPPQVDELYHLLGQHRRGMRGIASPEMAVIKQCGGRLFESVFHSEMLAAWRGRAETAAAAGSGLRLRLDLSSPPDLAALPWEYLYDRGLDRFLALSASTPVVRYLGTSEAVRELSGRRPLRLLLVTASPVGYSSLMVEHEKDLLLQAVSPLVTSGQLVVEPLEHVTLAQLQRRLRGAPVHLFHFIGHGGFNPDREEGVLVLEREDRRAEPVGAELLGTLLHDHPSLVLAVLNACEGARSSPDNPFSGVAQTLLRQRLPAAIAMQAAIANEPAVALSHHLYEVLAQGESVDCALSEARKAIYGTGDEVSWGIPVLYLRPEDGRLFGAPSSPQVIAEGAPQAKPTAPRERQVVPVPTVEDTGHRRRRAPATLYLATAAVQSIAWLSLGGLLWALLRFTGEAHTRSSELAVIGLLVGIGGAAGYYGFFVLGPALSRLTRQGARATSVLTLVGSLFAFLLFLASLSGGG